LPPALVGPSAAPPVIGVCAALEPVDLAGALADMAFVAFASAMPLWLVREGVAPDASSVGWTLAVLAGAAAPSSPALSSAAASSSRRCSWPSDPLIGALALDEYPGSTRPSPWTAHSLCERPPTPSRRLGTFRRTPLPPQGARSWD